MRSFRCVLWVLSLVSALLWAQTYTASVRGTVTDPSQAGVPGATVTLTEVDRNLAYPTKTDGAGRYGLPSVPPGMYQLTAEAAGFRKYERAAFRLDVQQAATINIELSVGEITTAVEVTTSAPLLNTAAATLGQVVENKYISTMPLATRDAITLVGLTPGIVPAGGSAGGTSGVNFVSNGVRNSSSDAMLDGTLITGIEQNGGITQVKYTPSVDVIEEFKVQTNFFSAEFGNTGGTIINLVSKSGTNEVHGVVYEFRRDNALNANDFFSNRQGGHLTDSKRDLFGGTLGGPVFIPKVYNGKNRTFFFFDYEGNRSKNFASTTSTVPTDLQEKGDFTDTRRANGNLYIIYNPFDIYTTADGTRLRRPFEGNKIPPNMINPISKNILQYYPGPTSQGNQYTHINNFYAQGSSQSGSNKMDAKIDHNFSEKQRLTGRYSVNWAPTDNAANLIGNIAGTWYINSGRSQNVVLDYTRTHSPTTVMTLRFGLLRNRSTRDPGSVGFNSNTLGFPEILRTGGVYNFPYWAVSGYQRLGSGEWGVIHLRELSGQLSSSVTKIVGPHTIKAGAEFRRYYENYTQPANPNGGFSFSRGVTGVNPLLSSSSQGDGFASMLLGWGSGSAQDKWVDSPAATSSGYFGTYVQDDWRITPKLTLNLGVRYDFDIPRTDRWNRLQWMDISSPSPIAGQVPLLPGRSLMGIMRYTDGDHRSPFNGDYNNVQPRIGIAYALGSKMSIRAAYGIFFTAGRHTIKGEVGPSFRTESPLLWSRDSGFTQFATLQNPYPLGLTPVRGRNAAAEVGFGASTYPIDSKNPQYQQWNFSIQRQLPGNGILEINYSASKGTHLYFGTGDELGDKNKLDTSYWSLGRDVVENYVPNPFYGIITDPQSSLSLPTVIYQQLLRPYPQYGTVCGYECPPNIANSSYHAVQFKYEKRFSNGLALLAHYTISKMISDSDSPGTDIDWLGGAGGVQNWKNLRLERSLASFDIPQRAIITFNYQLPVGRGKPLGRDMNKVLNRFVGGWEMSGILTFSSGFPIAPGLDSANLLSGTQRPNLIGDPSTSGPASERIDHYFNEAAFSQPDTDVYGTAPRMLSSYRSYGVRTGDMTLMKNFVIKERKSVQFRLEAFNVTNTPCFGLPDSNYGADTFGTITSTSIPARTLQVAVKFYY